MFSWSRSGLVLVLFDTHCLWNQKRKQESKRSGLGSHHAIYFNFLIYLDKKFRILPIDYFISYNTEIPYRSGYIYLFMNEWSAEQNSHISHHFQYRTEYLTKVTEICFPPNGPSLFYNKDRCVELARKSFRVSARLDGTIYVYLDVSS